jgi:hypothetical protein
MLITLLVVSLLCLAFDSTRVIGVGGMTVLFFFLYLPLLVGFLILGAVSLFYIQHYK